MKCTHCDCPIGDYFPRLRAQGNVVCQLCYELRKAIYQNAHFIEAHSAWHLEMEKLNKLRVGADYFRETEET